MKEHKQVDFSPLFELQKVDVQYCLDKKNFLGLRQLSLQGREGQTLGIVGESGCGKSTLAKTLLYLQKPSQGKVFFDGKELALLSKQELRLLRKDMQLIFQDPDASLNPRMSIQEHLKEALIAHNLLQEDVQRQLQELLHMVQLPFEMIDRYPFQLSGGQKQRVSIARALSVKPKLLVCDEPLSSLDVSVRAQMIQLLKDLQRKQNLAYLFITHDLTTLRHLAHQIAVLYLGNLVEIGSRDSIYATPLHPYTQALLSAIAIPDPKKEKKRHRIILQGDVPSILTPPKGCVFHTRCPHAMPICKTRVPEIIEARTDHFVSCHLYDKS